MVQSAPPNSAPNSVVPSGLAALLQGLEDDHAMQRALCDDLETIADDLPSAPSPALVRAVADRLGRVSTEQYPRALTVLRALPGDHRPHDSELAALEAMHSNDASHSEDLVSALWDQIEGNANRNDGQLGYMLRCYFDGARRAIALTEALVARVTDALPGPALNADGPARAGSPD